MLAGEHVSRYRFTPQLLVIDVVVIKPAEPALVRRVVGPRFLRGAVAGAGAVVSAQLGDDADKNSIGFYAIVARSLR